MLQRPTVALALRGIAYLLRVGVSVLAAPAAPVLGLGPVGDVASFFFGPVVAGAGGVAVVVFGAAGFAGWCASHDE